MMRRSSGPSRPRDGSSDDEDAYFTYRPLSNLPTPPPSSAASSRSSCSSANSPLAEGEPPQARFLGPAIHLVNLIPASASLSPPSVPLVQAILSRASLPLDTVALAVCILDSLDSKKFARRWRGTCPLIDNGDDNLPEPSAPEQQQQQEQQQPYCPPSPSPSPSPRQRQRRHRAARHSHTRAATSQTHIDSVRPEIIILAALVIAVKFLEDPQDPTEYYCRVWAAETWSNRQLNTTERCLMEELGYRLMPLCDEGLLADAMVDMQLAGRCAAAARAAAGWAVPRAPPVPAVPSDHGGGGHDDRVSAGGGGEAGPAIGLGLHLASVDDAPLTLT